MSNLIQNTTDLAMSIACQYIKSGGLVIDATCGNGHDTLRLAEYIRSRSLSADMIAFDIQEEAIESTRVRLADAGFDAEATADFPAKAITLIRDSHENMASYTGEASACLIVFNLGYLPGGDKNVTTKAQSTIDAVKASLELLDTDGLICITMYSGHNEGAKEKQALLAFAEELDSRKYHVTYISMINQPSNPPEILLISRKR